MNKGCNTNSIYISHWKNIKQTTIKEEETRRTIHQAAGGKLRDKNAKESWALLEDLALYDNESWNDPRDFAKSVKAIYLPQDVPITFDRRLIELKNQVQRLMKAHLAPKSLVQVNKIASSCEICSGPHDTQYCMKNPEQPFVEYTSSRNNKVGGKLKLVEDFYAVDMEKDPTCPLLVGRGFLATASAVIDCKKDRIAIGEGITRSIFSVKEINFGEENIPCWTTIGKRESYTPQPSTDGIGARPLTMRRKTS
ncbi:hypothetical protein Tco_0435564 [Tanacetum coccineum]